jgi:hypothetical protein
MKSVDNCKYIVYIYVIIHYFQSKLAIYDNKSDVTEILWKTGLSLVAAPLMAPSKRGWRKHQFALR